MEEKDPMNLSLKALPGGPVTAAAFGFITPAGKMQIAPRFEMAGAFSEGLAHFKEKTLFGYIDDKGHVVIKPQFALASEFSNGLAKVRVDGALGFVDRSGALAFKGAFDDATKFSKNVGAVKVKGLWGIVDRKGKFVHDPQFKNLAPWSEDHAVFGVDGQCGLLNADGDVVVKPAYDALYDVHEGLAAFEKDGKSGYVDTKGKVVIPARFDRADDFREARARVQVGGAFGYIDPRGKLVIEAKYPDLNPRYGDMDVYGFREGLALFRDGELFGFLDKQGAVAIPARFSEATLFHEGRAQVRTEDYEKAFIDPAGKVVLKHEYDEARDFDQGVAVVKSKQRYGLINLAGKVVVPIEHEMIAPFSGGLACIRSTGADEKATRERLDAINADLRALEKEIAPTVRKFIRLRAVPRSGIAWDKKDWCGREIGDGGAKALLASKFGGVPYLPKDHAYPVDEKGKAMFLLAQLNLESLPKLEGFPEKGVLQFYAAGEHGFNAKKGKSFGFQALYFPDADAKSADLAAAKKGYGVLGTFADVPVEHLFHLEGKEAEAPISPSDFAFDDVLSAKTRKKLEAEGLGKAYWEIAEPGGHKIGGYPYFTQEDPRTAKSLKTRDYSTLLFQMDSETGINWGDAGVANVFISPANLKKRDFSDLLFTFDCL